MKKSLLIITLLLLSFDAMAINSELTAFTIKQTAAGSTYNVNIQMLVVMTLITLLPALLMTMTSFTRVMIVLAILRQALGMPNVPSNQILMGISLFLSLFIMSPVITKINNNSLQPYIKHQLTGQQALDKASTPFKQFMVKQIRTDDFHLFIKLAKQPTDIKPADAPLYVLMPAFLTSELKTAFQMGFLIYIPFLIIDLVVASVLMSMGMMMLSPLVISLPFKLMLFVMVNGWVLVIGSLTSSFIR